MPKSPKTSGRMSLIFHYVKDVFPLVRQELKRWEKAAHLCPDEPLARQALASIAQKRFHCQGGSIFALYPGANSQAVVEFVVAYQTISDYLDNLVDSLQVENEQAFRQLHLAMLDALSPSNSMADYYRYYPYQDDGGYLVHLVKVCQLKIAALPAYSVVQEPMLWLAGLYSDLQTYKHLALVEREAKMLTWAAGYQADYAAITPWEFAAASGSTLGIFCLYAAALDPDLSLAAVKSILQAYFPWISGLHILLDYFIDLEEDRSTAQLNFIEYYADNAQISKRLSFFITESFQHIAQLSNADFHFTVIQGLLAMYLSDPKSNTTSIVPITRQLLDQGGFSVKLLHWLCQRLRDYKII